MSTLARISLGRLVPVNVGVSEVVGGFINVMVSESPGALIGLNPINASVSANAVCATVVSTFTGTVMQPIEAIVQPVFITAELLDG